MKLPRRTERGVSLTEILVVIAIILILASFLVVGLEFMHTRAIAVNCQHHLEQIGYALSMYSTNNHGMLPASKCPIRGWLWYETLAATYVKEPTVLGCPYIGPPQVSSMEELAARPVRQNVDAYHKGLYWLKKKQRPSGQFPAVGAWQDAYNYANASSAFALMAFFSFDCNDRYPIEFASTVRKGVHFLANVAQTKTGTGAGLFNLGGGASGRAIANTAVCVMAMAAASRMIEDPTLRAQAASAAALGMQWIANNTAYHGAYQYATAAPTSPEYDASGKLVGPIANLSHSTWVYQAVGIARLTGIPVPSSMDAPMQFILAQNASTAGGRWGWRWNPFASNGTYGDWGGWTHVGAVARLSLGDSPGSPVVASQINWIRRLRTNDPKIPTHIYDALYESPAQCRFHMYHQTRALRMAGGTAWDEWVNPNPNYVVNGQPWPGYTDIVRRYLQDDGSDDEGNATGYWRSRYDESRPPSVMNGIGGNSQVGHTYATGVSLMMLGDAYENTWLDENYQARSEGACSYGYNHALSELRRTPAADTIVVMDYESWLINRTQTDPASNDGDQMIAVRHSGQANALMGDGSVRALSIGDITQGMFTPQAGD